MSTQPDHGIDRPLEEQAVVEYLRKHPDFFVSQAALLTELVLPHPSGEAVSLIERQVALFREQNQRLRQQLQSLVRNARNNEVLGDRMHRLTLSLLACDRADNVFTTLHERLRVDFDADALSICLTAERDGTGITVADKDGLSVRRVAPRDLHDFEKVLQSNTPVCGRLTQRQLHYLFGEAAGKIASVALVPLGAAGEAVPAQSAALGIMGIGSHDHRRFQAGMGTVFLNQLADILTAKLQAHLG